MTPTPHKPAVLAKGLQKHFAVRLGIGKKQVLCGLDFECQQGANYGLIGPNGSGKSTLQRILAGADRPSSGHLEVLGGSLSSSGIRARIGYVPEDSPFPGELSARAVLDLMGSLNGLSRRHVTERGMHLLEQVGLAEHASKALRSFSRGMLRRFALAQAWLHEPDLLLLDEPTAGLDGQGFEVLALLLTEARERGATIIFSSHILSDLMEHCDQVFVLLQGRFVAQGAPQELFSKENSWRIHTAQMSEQQAQAAGAWIEQNGGRVERITPGGKTLFELYHEHS